MGWKFQGSNPAGTGDFSLLKNKINNVWSFTYTFPIRLNSVGRDRFTSTYFGIT